MGHDPEIQAASVVYDALSALEDDEARERVLQWMAKRFGISLPAPGGNGATAPTLERSPDPSVRSEAEGGVTPVTTPSTYEEFHELFDDVEPTTDGDRALLAAYWIQEINGAKQFTGFEVNKELKQLGYGVTNITRTLGGYMQRSPALVRQKTKSGKAKQSKKTYVLTDAGRKYVEQLLKG